MLWNAELVTVEDLNMTIQEVHCMVQVWPNPIKWLFSSNMLITLLIYVNYFGKF